MQTAGSSDELDSAFLDRCDTLVRSLPWPSPWDLSAFLSRTDPVRDRKVYLVRWNWETPACVCCEQTLWTALS